MEKQNTKKEYSNGEITVVWQPAKCIHSEICVKMLPEVYDPKARPWIDVENASTAALKNQIEKCPSGALTYYMNGAEETEEQPTTTKVNVLENGPLIVNGKIIVVDKAGKEEVKEDKTAFCRCGASSNKPYCDGTHSKINFEG